MDVGVELRGARFSCRYFDLFDLCWALFSVYAAFICPAMFFDGVCLSRLEGVGYNDRILTKIPGLVSFYYLMVVGPFCNGLPVV